jgi:ubiquinone biosynthesis protein COQ4
VLVNPSWTGSVAIPYRVSHLLDLVATLGEVTGEMACIRMLERMKLRPDGRRLLAEQPLITRESIGLDTRLSALPENTFGKAYYRFMQAHDLCPDSRAQVRHILDPLLAYVLTRYRQVHDFWHVLAGLPIDLVGEIGLKALEAAETGLPMTKLAAVVGPLRLRPSERQLYVKHMVPWALRCSASCKPGTLMSLVYEEHLDKDLDAFRQEIGFISWQPPSV